MIVNTLFYQCEITDTCATYSTGVGGFTLGGGYGYLTGEHGFAIDNLLEAEVVIANGEIVRASSNENEDLFWALRGAGQNFGVVTEFTFRAHEVPEQVWGGLLFFPPGELATVLDFANKAHELDTGKAPIVSL